MERCQELGHDPFTMTTPILADFVTHLVTVKKFTPLTIVGYHTTVVNTLERVTSQCLTDEHLIASLINQFEAESPCAGQFSPDQDLALVLHMLHSALFQPVSKAPLWVLTFKTVFFKALASAKLHSKLHAFCYHVKIGLA